MAELDTSGHCLLPGRLQTDSKSIQVSPLSSVLCPVLSSVLFFVLQEAIEVLISEQALINEVTDQCSVNPFLVLVQPHQSAIDINNIQLES